MGDFFILGKFQGQGIGRQVAHQLWNMYLGLWQVAVIPENKPAIEFWKKTIEDYTADNYQVENKTVDCNVEQFVRLIFTFKVPIEN